MAYAIINGELYHHGIKGQRWGVRRFQNGDGSLTNAGKKRYSDGTSSKENNTEENNGDTKKGLSKNQKRCIIVGASVVAAALAAYGGYKVYQGYIGKDSIIDPDTGLKLLKHPETDEQMLKQINPGKISFLSRHKNVEIINGSSNNCMLCTTSYELRKRGYDVRAGFEPNGFLPDTLFPKIYKNYTGTEKIPLGKDAAEKYNNLMTALDKYEDGSRGNVMVWWGGLAAGGHSMIWEKVNGNVVFKDGQTNEVYKDFTKQILKHTSATEPIEILRTDNLDINPSGIKKFMNMNTLTKTYVDHGAEIAYKLATNPTIQATTIAAVTTAIVAKEKATERKKVKEYKKKHPNTKLSDERIRYLVNNGRSEE